MFQLRRYGSFSFIFNLIVVLYCVVYVFYLFLILQGMEYTHMESLIPLKDEAENKALDERRNTESYRLALEENKDLTEQVFKMK